MPVIALVFAVLVAVAPIALIYRLVAREDAKRAATASDEMWSRTLEDFQNDERASRDGLTRSESRIGHTGPTKNSNALHQV